LDIRFKQPKRHGGGSAPGDGASTLAVVLINRGPSDISGITGRLTLPDGFKATGKAAGAPAIATYNQVAKVGNTFTLFFDVDVRDSAKVGEYNARLSVDYSKYYETGTPRNTEMSVPFRITGEAIVAVSRTYTDGNASSQITAGKIEDYTFSVANNGNAPITNVVVTMESLSESLKILGDTKWTIQKIEEDSKVDLATRVFAANSLIGNPASFDVTVAYSSNGQSSSVGFVMGTYVAGEIVIRIYDLAINYIGDTPNLVGNLLNEGNTAALFTTIELVQSPVSDNGGAGQQQITSSLPPQYLGDLTEDSPLPFSIPVDLSSSNPANDPYPVTVKVTYKDELRNEHEFVTSENVILGEKQSSNLGVGAGHQSLAMGMLIPIIVGIAAAAGGVVFFVRRRKSRSKRRHAENIAAGDGENIEMILDESNEASKKDGSKPNR